MAGKSQKRRVKKRIRIDGPLINWAEFQPDHPNYDSCFRACADYLREESYDTKKLKEETLTWFKNDQNTKEVKALSIIPDHKFYNLGKYYYMLNNGAIFSNETVEWLAPKMRELIGVGNTMLTEQEIITSNKRHTPIDIAHSQLVAGNSLADELEELILTDRFNGDSTIVYDTLNNHIVSPTAFRHTIARLNLFIDEFNTFTTSEIKEGFKDRAAFNQAKMNYVEIHRIATNFGSNERVRRKVGKKRKITKTSAAGRALKTVEKVKVMKEFPTLNLVSVPLEKMVGAKGVMVYDTKNRKIGLYQAKDSDGIQITGTTLKNFDEKTSGQKILRNPSDQIESLREVTLKRAEIIMRDNIRAKMANISGRLNANIVVMAAWK